MEQYRDCLITYDRTEKVPLTDVRKLAGWYKIIGDKIACKRVMSEVNARAKNRLFSQSLFRLLRMLIRGLAYNGYFSFC